MGKDGTNASQELKQDTENTSKNQDGKPLLLKMKLPEDKIESGVKAPVSGQASYRSF